MSLFSNDATIYDSFFWQTIIIPSAWGHINQPIERFQYVGALKEPIKRSRNQAKFVQSQLYHITQILLRDSSKHWNSLKRSKNQIKIEKRHLQEIVH